MATTRRPGTVRLLFRDGLPLPTYHNITCSLINLVSLGLRVRLKRASSALRLPVMTLVGIGADRRLYVLVSSRQFGCGIVQSVGFHLTASICTVGDNRGGDGDLEE